MRRTLRVAGASGSGFSYVILTCYGGLRVDFNFQISLVMHSLVNIHLTVNSCAESKSTLLQGVGYLHRQKHNP